MEKYFYKNESCLDCEKWDDGCYPCDECLSKNECNQCINFLECNQLNAQN